MENTQTTAAKRAIALMGGARKVAERFGLSVQAVYKWDQVPVTKVLAIEEETKGQVTRHEMRPDVFGSEATMKRAGERPA